MFRCRWLTMDLSLKFSGQSAKRIEYEARGEVGPFDEFRVNSTGETSKDDRRQQEAGRWGIR